MQRLRVNEELARSPYDIATGNEKVRLIGNAIYCKGEEWIRSHPRQVRWLADQGITPKQAADAFAEWRRKKKEDWRWSPEDGD